jgi:hypothetical protein
VRALIGGLLLALACAAPPVGVPEETYTGGPELDLGRLRSLARDFYDRLENRRFNSLATFQDPGLREFFRTRESYSDYYAELAFELESARFEASRPTRVEVDAAARVSASQVRLWVRFTGENGLPLRWWEIDLVREDVWEIDQSGRWWIVPGKV